MEITSKIILSADHQLTLCRPLWSKEWQGSKPAWSASWSSKQCQLAKFNSVNSSGSIFLSHFGQALKANGHLNSYAEEDHGQIWIQPNSRRTQGWLFLCCHYKLPLFRCSKSYNAKNLISDHHGSHMYTLKKYFGHLREVFKYILATFFARAPSLLCRLRTKNSVLALDIKAIRLKMYHICMAKMEQNGLRLELG